MSGGTMAVIIAVAVIVILIAAAAAMTTRTRRLRRRFGPEYDRVVESSDSRLKAEAELAERQRRVRRLQIQPLSDVARNRYEAEWIAVQEQFVDSPQAAVAHGYSLVRAVMKERGYPVDDLGQAMADLSVDHAHTLQHFRAAQEISQNAAAGHVATEDLRRALLHYRELFSDLLGDQRPSPDGWLEGLNDGSAEQGPVAAGTGAQPPAAAPADTEPKGLGHPSMTGRAELDREDLPDMEAQA
jgi:hypothetical protein